MAEGLLDADIVRRAIEVANSRVLARQAWAVGDWKRAMVVLGDDYERRGPELWRQATGQPVAWEACRRSQPAGAPDRPRSPECEWADIQAWDLEPMTPAMQAAFFTPRKPRRAPKGRFLRQGQGLNAFEDSEVSQVERGWRWASGSGWLDAEPGGETVADYLARGGVIRRVPPGAPEVHSTAAGGPVC